MRWSGTTWDGPLSPVGATCLCVTDCHQGSLSVSRRITRRRAAHRPAGAARAAGPEDAAATAPAGRLDDALAAAGHLPGVAADARDAVAGHLDDNRRAELVLRAVLVARGSPSKCTMMEPRIGRPDRAGCDPESPNRRRTIDTTLGAALSSLAGPCRGPRKIAATPGLACVGQTPTAELTPVDATGRARLATLRLP